MLKTKSFTDQLSRNFHIIGIVAVVAVILALLFTISTSVLRCIGTIAASSALVVYLEMIGVVLIMISQTMKLSVLHANINRLLKTVIM